MRNATTPAEARTGPEPKCATCGHGTLAHNAIGGACTKCDCGHFRAKAEAQTPRERMTALVNPAPLATLATLATSLLMLDAKPNPDEAERLTRAVIIDAICERCPAADAAFWAWAEGDDEDPHAAVNAIVAAVKGA